MNTFPVAHFKFEVVYVRDCRAYCGVNIAGYRSLQSYFLRARTPSVKLAEQEE